MSCSEWKEYCLNEVIDKCIDYRGRTPKKVESGIPLITAKIVKNGIIQEANEFIKYEDYDNWMTRGIPNKGDVVMTTEAPLGEVAQINTDKKIALAQRIITLRGKNGLLDNTFLMYSLQSPVMQSRLEARASGTTVLGIKSAELKKVAINLPSIEEQIKISSILSSLDRKIELNNEMNKTLEEMAQALFKRWFVDFEFPNEDSKPYKSSGGEMVESELGMIPKGWRVSSLDNIANYLNGLAMQKYRPESDEFIPVIKIKDLGNGRTDNSSDKASINIPKQYIINDGDVIFSWSGTLMVKIWTGGIGGLNQHLFKVTSEEYDKWYYYLWTNYHLEKFNAIAKDKATTMGHIKRSNLTEARVLVPDVDVYIRLNNIMKPIIDKIIEVNVQSKQLSELRNSLLPKLMSGEIRVEDIEVNL